jgi:macrolide transport system ATP-binding/permease protein
MEGVFFMAGILLEADHLRKSFGPRQLIDLDHLSVYDGEKIGLIGENGAGKTTLLRLLSGETEADEGTVRRPGSLAFIRQQGKEDGEADDQMQALFRVRSRRDGLSGGEMTRGRIAAALSARPQLLFADEPTTDLDEEGLALLRKQLQAFPGALVLVSHDRSLLRLLCRRIWYLEDGKITDFPGGYDAFMEERRRQRDRQHFEYDQYRAEQKRLKESVQRMAEKASSVRKAPSRMGNSEARLHKREWTDSVLQLSHAKRTLQNRMEHLEAKEKPRNLPDIRMKLGVSSPVEAGVVLRVQCERLAAGKTELLSRTAFSRPTGSRTALLGANGCGKTTLLRVLTGQGGAPVCFDGKIQFNPAARIAWFDQHHEKTLDPEKTVLENVMDVSVHPESLARTVLIRLNFRRDDVFKPVSVLSGGERAKVALARLLLMDCNLLVLDEPTNHLDLFTLEELERLLADYGGTILFVSHDEEFVRKTATRIVRFDRRKLVSFEGTLDEMKNASRRDTSAEELRLAVSALEMRMAALAARMSALKRGDRPDQLQAEYLEIAEKLRELKRKAGAV